MEPDLLEPLDPAVSGATSEQEPAPSKPVALPAPRNVAERRIARELRGHTASAAWLPSGWPELDPVREQHRHLVDAIAAGMDELRELERGWRAEDQAFAEKLRLAVRAGSPVPEDTRTDVETREQRRGALTDQTWAAAHVLSEVVQETLALLREREGAILERLRGERLDAEAKVRELQQLLQEARVQEWWLHQQAAWLMHSVDDGPLGRQPAPVPSPPPPTFDRALLERPWSRPQPAAT